MTTAGVDDTHDQRRSISKECFGVDAGRRGRSFRYHHDIGGRHVTVAHGPLIGFGRVKRHELLAAVPLAGAVWPRGRTRWFDPNSGRAVVGEHHRADRAGHTLGEVDNLQISKCSVVHSWPPFAAYTNSMELMLCWGTVNAGTVIDLAEAAAAASCSAVSVSPRLYQATLDAGFSADQQLAALVRNGVRVAVIEPLLSALPGTHTPETAPPEMRGLWTFDTDYCLNMADALDAEYISLSHFLGWPTPLDELTEAAAAVVDAATERGRLVCIEFIPDSGVGDLATALAIRHGVGHELTLMVDVWHHARAGGTVAELTGLDPSAISILQLCDRVTPAPGAPYVPMAGRLLPGEGELPLEATVAVLVAEQSDLLVGVEVFSADLQALPAPAAAVLAADATRAVLARALG